PIADGHPPRCPSRARWVPHFRRNSGFALQFHGERGTRLVEAPAPLAFLLHFVDSFEHALEGRADGGDRRPLDPLHLNTLASRRPRFCRNSSLVSLTSSSVGRKLKPCQERTPTMTRWILALLAFGGLALSPLASSGCSQTGVGDPCTPEQEYDPTFNGFNLKEVNVE